VRAGYLFPFTGNEVSRAVQRLASSE